MKKFIVIGLLVILVFLIGYRMAALREEASNSDYTAEQTFLPVTHRVHTHEHEGISCCPCGACHKKEDEEHQIDLPWYTRLTASVAVIVFIFSQLHEIIPILFG